MLCAATKGQKILAATKSQKMSIGLQELGVYQVITPKNLRPSPQVEEYRQTAITAEAATRITQSLAPQFLPTASPDFLPPAAAFYDLNCLDFHAENLIAAFGPTFHHHLAMKSCPLGALLKYLREKYDFGSETASWGEVFHAGKCGFEPQKIIFDSPCKTAAELQKALEMGVYVNLDNFDELEMVKDIMKSRQEEFQSNSSSTIGLRVNPLVGEGTIKALSVSGADSKFGIAITEREKIIQAYKENIWLNAIHVHVGSGGMGVRLLTTGIAAVVDLALEILHVTGRGGEKDDRFTIDIGGGLPANYASDVWKTDATMGVQVPSYSDYAAALRETCPELFKEGGKFRVCTEFGQSFWAKLGFLAGRVQFVKRPSAPDAKTKVITHFGADNCLRQAYTVEHGRRVLVIKANQYDAVELETSTEPVERADIAGPLCFQGDFIGRGVAIPKNVQQGDLVLLQDAGANSLSMYSRHCSRPALGVVGYRENAEGGEVEAGWLRKPESLQDVSQFWM